MKGKERKGNEMIGKERKGKERKGKENKFLHWIDFVSVKIWLNELLTPVKKKDHLDHNVCVPCPRFSQDLDSIEKAVWKIRRLGAPGQEAFP